MGVTTPRFNRAIAVLVAGAFALGATGCAQKGDAPDGEGTAKVLTVAASASVTTWDPVRSFSTEATYLGNIYEPLIWKNPEGSNEDYSPGVASSWTQNDAGTEWTFKIRTGATFHDGSVVDADAVKASIDAARDHAGASFIWAPIDTVDAVDAETLVVKLLFPAPLDLIVSSTYGAWIVSPDALKASSKDATYFDAGLDAGSGPFKLKTYTPGQEVVLEKFDDYWNEDAQPFYDIVDISITSDAITAQQMLTAGEVDYATNVPLESIEELASGDEFTLETAASPFNFLGYFNTQKAPFDDPLVRQALSYAIPYEDIIKVGSQGFGSQSHGPVPKGIFPFSKDTPQYQYDIEKAKSLLAEAGHAGGGFDMNLTYAAENLSESKFVPLIKDSFAKIGVTVNVKSQLFNQQWEDAKGDPKKAQDMFVLYYWPTYSDAGSDNLNSMFHSRKETSFNLSYWNNPEYDTLIDKAIKMSGEDRDGAQKLFDKAQTQLVDQAPGVFFYDLEHVQLVPKKLKVGPYNGNYPFTTFFSTFAPAE